MLLLKREHRGIKAICLAFAGLMLIVAIGISIRFLLAVNVAHGFLASMSIGDQAEVNKYCLKPFEVRIREKDGLTQLLISNNSEEQWGFPPGILDEVAYGWQWNQLSMTGMLAPQPYGAADFFAGRVLLGRPGAIMHGRLMATWRGVEFVDY